jgi:hypothetical protein
MKKEYFVLESRKMKKLGKLIPNDTVHVIGIFSAPERVENWIKKYGKSYFSTDKQRKVGDKDDNTRFWACLVGNANSGEMILHHFYNMDGNTINEGSLEYQGE